MAEPKPTEAPADPQVAALAKLRVPFTANQISKLPKPTKAQNDAVKDNFKAGIRCKICGGWHHPNVVHLDYVGHAALTDRLLDVDPLWTWNPVAEPASLGLPVTPGGMWITLTVCGMSRYGFGHPDGKTGGDAIKETIGDALRNAAMRFGAALDLWHKGELHTSDDGNTDSGPREPSGAPPKDNPPPRPSRDISTVVKSAGVAINLCNTEAALTKWSSDNAAMLESMDPADKAAVREHYGIRLERMRALGPEKNGDAAGEHGE